VSIGRLITHFDAADDGSWHVVRMSTLVGPPLQPIERLSVADQDAVTD
jgi:hypothetical protein